MPIRVLENNLINQIAAGEVVERPASVVKELVENAIDAGGTRIEISIIKGGTEQIQVTDNGQGMEPEELHLAFARHATSKISSEEDLFNIHTLGFRGEALPSIASVARVEMVTACRDGEGSFVRIEGGKVIASGPRGFPRGTQVTVRDLFFNTPARRKFLKSETTEANRIYELVSRLAFSHPSISFTLLNERRTVFKTPGSGRLEDVIHCILGRDFVERMITVAYRHDEVEVWGMVSRPQFTRGNRKDQVFVVNGRVVRSPLLFRALDEAYRGLLVSREFPAAVLFLKLSPAQVDVNVHPQKTEVRFRDESSVFNVIRQAIRSTLVNQGVSLNQSSMETGPEPVVAEPDPVYRPGRELWRRPAGPTVLPWMGEAAVPLARLPLEKGNEFCLLGQWLNSYILVGVGEELWLIDQHAAHERVMYEKLKAGGGVPVTQTLAVPLSFDLPASKIQVLEDYHEACREFGLKIELLGQNTVVVRSAPPSIQGREMEVVEELLEMLAEGRPEDLLTGERVLALMACKSAMKAGTPLQQAEMIALVKNWLATDNYHHCPHGRPAMIILTAAEMERRLKRKL